MNFHISKTMAVGTLLATAIFTGNLLAHHSTTMFDREKTITLKGTVKEIHWTNPHVAIYIDNMEKQSNADEGVWLIELTSPGNLVRSGWTRNAVKPGDKVTATVHPLRSGNKGAALNKIVLADSGQTFTYNIRDADRPNIDQDPQK